MNYTVSCWHYYRNYRNNNNEIIVIIINSYTLALLANKLFTTSYEKNALVPVICLITHVGTIIIVDISYFRFVSKTNR